MQSRDSAAPLPRDQREMMERPFFSLARGKRTAPIDYRSPAGDVRVLVEGDPALGMATIRDADVLIHLISLIAACARAGEAPPAAFLLRPRALLRAIGRGTTGESYRLLEGALDRLRTTRVTTTIRAGSEGKRRFRWLDDWVRTADGLALTPCAWLVEGAAMPGGVLAIDPAYFALAGGRERFLYRCARKHAGGAGAAGFAISLPTLYAKSGALGGYDRFARWIRTAARADPLPGYTLAIEPRDGRAPMLRMRQRDTAAAPARVPTPAPPPTPERTRELMDAAALIRRSIGGLAARGTAGSSGAIGERALTLLRAECPGWDYQSLHADFSAWVAADPARTPRDRDAAFIGYVRRWHAGHRHELRG